MSRISFFLSSKINCLLFLSPKALANQCIFGVGGGKLRCGWIKIILEGSFPPQLPGQDNSLLWKGAANNAAAVSPKRGVRGLETQEHSRVLFNSMSSVSWAGKMLLKDESFPGQGFTLQPDLRNYLGPRNRDFSTQNKVCTVSLPQ